MSGSVPTTLLLAIHAARSEGLFTNPIFVANLGVSAKVCQDKVYSARHLAVVHTTITMLSSSQTTDSRFLTNQIRAIDETLSKRPLALDPAGYFIVYVDREQQLICAKFYSTLINEQGLATDPDTGEVIPARGKTTRVAEQLFTGRSAKELCVTLFETLASKSLITQLSHAAYLGRELQRAELALIEGIDYVQD